MYLEQELESLKAVLEIKNEKLREQDVKLMKMEKLVGLLWVASVETSRTPRIPGRACLSCKPRTVVLD